MKRIKIFLSTALSAAAILVGNPFTATAQQLPNNGFEEGWVDCVPWTSSGNTKTKVKRQLLGQYHMLLASVEPELPRSVNKLADIIRVMVLE